MLMKFLTLILIFFPFFIGQWSFAPDGFDPTKPIHLPKKLKYPAPSDEQIQKFIADIYQIKLHSWPQEFTRKKIMRILEATDIYYLDQYYQKNHRNDATYTNPINGVMKVEMDMLANLFKSD